MKTRVLVFPCGTEIGLEINRSLGESSDIELYGASSDSSNHGRFIFKNYVDGIPFTGDARLIGALNDLIEEHRIHFIYPAHDSVVTELSKQSRHLKCPTIGSESRTCAICRSKLKTYDLFGSKVNVPRVYEDCAASLPYPVFLKPEEGQGSQGTHIANSQEEVDFYLHRDKSLFILEYLPGKEYTIDCFTDRHGRLRFSGGRERIRISKGISVNTKPIQNSAFHEIAAIINAQLSFRGTWFYQVKSRADGELVLMEIAPRIAGSMGLYRNLGVNLPLLSVLDAMGIDVDPSPNEYEIEMDRALTNRFNIKLGYEHVYLKLENTVIHDDGVNPAVMRFLYQCINKGIKIHLMTQHSEDVKQLLHAHRLDSSFDNILTISKKDELHTYITERPSI
ncbi:MAG: ATP-grasp domain-containing protein, partial [Planctomycetes bacterium]|nr:ATP-grasp domain-containing protein [Planctomycetota bacterium]